jgi:hypothetical protein
MRSIDIRVQRIVDVVDKLAQYYITLDSILGFWFTVHKRNAYKILTPRPQRKLMSSRFVGGTLFSLVVVVIWCAVDNHRKIIIVVVIISFIIGFAGDHFDIVVA